MPATKLNKFLGIYLLGWVSLIPFPFNLIPELGTWAVGLLEPMLNTIGFIFYPHCHNCIWEVVSDSAGMWLLAILVLLPSIIIYLIIRKKDSTTWLGSGLLFFLIIHMMKYGLEKVLFQQFTAPQPNLLFTPFGYLEKDILYWSTIGSSQGYNIFLGLAEILAALLLMIRKTRAIGLLCSTGIMLHVFVINLSFNIDVKLFSLTLLLISVYLSWPALVAIYRGMRSGTIILKASARRTNKYLRIVKRFALLLIIIESTIPVYHAWITPNTELTSLSSAFEIIDDQAFVRLFYHRAGYLILQSHDLKMTDYEAIRIADGYYLSENDELLSFDARSDRLIGRVNGRPIDWKIQRIDVQKLPLIRDQLEWSVKKPPFLIKDYPPSAALTSGQE